MNDTTLKYFYDVHIARELDYCYSLITECESPLEELFCIAFYSNGAKDDIESIIDYFVELNSIVILHPQKKVSKYRLDFLLEIRLLGEKPSFYDIEIDGHEFHEKTKDQVEKRNKRDMFLISNNIIPIHFSGSEIYKDVDLCIERLINLVTDNELAKRK